MGRLRLQLSNRECNFWIAIWASQQVASLGLLCCECNTMRAVIDVVRHFRDYWTRLDLEPHAPH